MFIYRKKFILCKPEGDESTGGPAGTNPLDGTQPDGSGAANTEGKQAAATTQKVKIGGEEFEMDPKIAQALNGLMSNMQNEIAALKAAQAPAPAAKPAAKDDAYDFSTGLFTEPDVALAKLEEKIKAEIRAEYQQEKSQADFWTTFYADNKELKGMEMLVDAVLNKNYHRLKDMPALESMKELAKLTKETALKLGIKREKADEGDDNGGDRTAIEGGSNPATKNSSQNKVNTVTSLSDIVKARQAAKRNPKRQAST